MSFADIASGNAPLREKERPPIACSTSVNAENTRKGTEYPSKAFNQSKQAMEAASFRLEQFQRQTIAIKRFASSLTQSKTNAAVDDDMQSRIRFATHLQEEIADSFKKLPQTNGNSLLKRKLCNDFQMISAQLENAVRDIAQYEQKLLKENQHDLEASLESSDRLHVEHDGKLLEFQALEQDIAQNEAIIEERERDITRIHQSVAQVNEIFRDLAAIVEEQQVAIDAIDSHVGESLMKTQQGLEQVRKAADSQRTCILQ